ncbi:pentatricopeptide repeat-containing protein At5g66520 [Phoenix dactylifera]|uniref:Pentatricopeptide repeat-containing protein At5g66520 n=1 Tax=Phoenix dactylifera TaxID=42345 RepID=A0A8B8J7M2_PHODC|nr:pentatricopeptide repeat-containing protein At5g66520 [Phoenix dactylifera]
MSALLLSPTSHIPLKPEAECIPSLDKCLDKEELKQVHARMIKTGLILDAIPASRLLVGLCGASDAGSLTYALMVFERIQNPNTFMWNTMIRSLSNGSNPEEAILLYSQMLHDAVPHNSYTFPFLLKACANLPSAAAETQQIHCHIIKTGFALEACTTNSLLHVYAKSGSILSASQLFDSIPCRDTVSWNSMINGYARSGKIEMARELFDQMENKNIISWTTMIAGYVENCLCKEALELFREMQAMDIEPDTVALASVLTACAHLGALDQGRWIHAYVKKKQIGLDPVLRCVLMDMFAKCGELDEALAVFRNTKERNVCMWTAMIAGFAAHGQGREALDLFADMERTGIKPNGITFTGVLTACSYAGMVEEGKSIFERIAKDCNMSPSVEHYGCMVDLLGRAGLLKEAEEMIKTMPVKPNAAVWGALLDACRVHRNFELGRRVGKILMDLEPKQSGRYVQLAGILAAEGCWDEAAAVRNLMKERGAAKLPGCSSISLSGCVHEFVAGDRSHRQTEEIYLEWDNILRRLKKGGYVPLTENLLLDLGEEEEKETAIHCHSEKLAIAFGFITTKPGATIRIVKNLRVCSDCHVVSKLISKVYSRKIIMRDRTRFHVFMNGQCSCGDYW